MEFRHLKYFIAVAEELHFTRAAERLHIEQSPLSRAIKDLEQDVGALLLERTTRGMRLTWAGQVMLEEARRMMTAVQQTKLKVSAAAEYGRRQLRIGLSDSFSFPRLIAALSGFADAEPYFQSRLLEMSFSQMVRAVKDDGVDLGIAWGPGEGVASQPIWKEAMDALIPAGHHLAHKRNVTLKELVNESLILPDPEIDPGCRGQVDSKLRTLTGDHPVRAVDEVAHLGMLITLVAANRGIGFVPRCPELEWSKRPDVVVREIDDPPMLTAYALTRQDNPFPPALHTFLQQAQRAA